MFYSGKSPDFGVRLTWVQVLVMLLLGTDPESGPRPPSLFSGLGRSQGKDARERQPVWWEWDSKFVCETHERRAARGTQLV